MASAAQTSAPSPAAGRLRFIDSIRGVAALLVLYQHAMPLFPGGSALENAIRYTCAYRLDFGRLAVAAFFMVSGYVVPFSLKGGRGEGLERFAISRFFRLYPLYWISLLLAIGTLAALHRPLPPEHRVLANLTMVQQTMHQPDIVGVYWTLPIEMLFYVLCAVFFALGWLNRRIVLIASCALSLALAIALAEGRQLTHHKLPVTIPTALTFMFLGTLWKRFQLDNDRASGRAVAWLVAALAVAIPIIAVLAYNDPGGEDRWFQYTNSYGLALILFFSMTTFARVHARPFVWLGNVSYGVYLLHEPVMDLYIRFVEPHVPVRSPHVQGALVAVATLALSDLLHRVLEEPMVELGKRISRHIRMRRLALSGAI